MKPPPQARWADRIIVRGAASPKEEAHVRAKLSGPLVDNFGVGPFELHKTGFELEVIKQVAKLLDVINSTVGLTPRGITPNRVHMLDVPSYRLIFGYGDDGCSVLGHTYIIRTTDHAAQVFLLTHELAHLSSHLSMISVSDTKSHYATWKKSGCAMQTNRGGAFTGLNEAAAEVVAGLVRDMLVRKRGLLDAATKKLLLSGYIYVAQVRIVQVLVARIAEFEDVDDAGPLMSLVSDFMTGKATFLRRANQAIPGASAILRAMGDDPNAALVATRALGLSEIADDIEEYANSFNKLEFE